MEIFAGYVFKTELLTVTVTGVNIHMSSTKLQGVHTVFTSLTRGFHKKMNRQSAALHNSNIYFVVNLRHQWRFILD